jgi:hypothetical protein
MAKRTGGNGSGKFEVHSEDLGGWVRVYSDPTANLPDNYPYFLSLTLTEWFRQRPQLRMRTVIPVVKDGATMELHAWYDLVIFPHPPAAKPASKP